MKAKILAVLIVLTVICSSCGFGCVSLGESERDGREYQISLTYDEKTGKLTGEMILDFTYLGENSLTNLLFFVYPNVFRESGGGMDIKSVYCDQKQIGFSESGEKDIVLDIPLPREIFGGDKVEIGINYEIRLTKNEGVLGIGEKCVKLSGFYPVLCVLENGGWVEPRYSPYGDLFFTEVSDYEIRLNVQKDTVVASSGKRTAKIESGDRVSYTYTARGIRDFAFCLGEYESVSGTVDGVLITSYAYSGGLCEKVLGYAKKALSFFGEKYGKYPHPTFSVCETDLSFGGMEYSALVMIDQDLEDSLEEVVVHEIAHQWWYGGVGSNPTLYAWLDEGLTEYSTLEYLSASGGEKFRAERISDIYQAYAMVCSVEKVISGRCDIPMSQESKQFNSLYEYSMVTYAKGLLFFDNLREITGKSLTDKILKDYYKTYRDKIVTPRELEEIFSTHSKINYTPIFRAWEEGKVIF